MKFNFVSLFMNNRFIYTSAPGRICLFGEHQDYLGLPVIAAAISKRMHIRANLTFAPKVFMNLPDINSYEYFDLKNLPLPYTCERDYFRSAVNVLLKEGFQFSLGISGELNSSIPINSGTASSSALIVSWLNVLSHLADKPRNLSPEELAGLAYKAEVEEFNEPGGMMDHYAVAVGGIIYLQMSPSFRLETLSVNLGKFVLGDSGEPKDTIGTMNRIKSETLKIAHQLKLLDPNFSLLTTTADELLAYRSLLSKSDFNLINGTIANRDISHKAITLLRKLSNEKQIVDHYLFGQLLLEHNDNLRDAQQILTPKINRMLDASLEAGALGGKINGSGGGGCMFAYAPNKTENVVEAIEKAGGRAYIVSIDKGVTVSQ
ncbi:GHMP family kinase ATP-binding protein [Fibrisoma limi]